MAEPDVKPKTLIVSQVKKLTPSEAFGNMPLGSCHLDRSTFTAFY